MNIEKKNFLFLTIFVILSLTTACNEILPPEPIVIETVVVEKEVQAPRATLQFWSTETQPTRAEVTQSILDRFEAQSGIKVELILTDENALPLMIEPALAAGTLPDVIFHPLDFTIGWVKEGILDPAAAAAVIESLGQDTFAQGPLDLVKVEGGFAAIPTDGWGQLIIYRTDLFEELNLEPPTTYEKIETAAAAIRAADKNIFGITAATKTDEVFTQQTFEHFAVANGCQLVNQAGEVALNTPACVEAVEFYTNLVRAYGPPGDQDVDSTRAAYFAGRAGMIVWSPFILDEMAGLRDNVMPTCLPCEENPAYLAENSGIVPAFAGPSGQPAQYGQVSYLGVTTNADLEATREFLTFWFNESYLEWLSVSTEGKIPMRRGTPEEPGKFIDGWKQLEIGVDRKASLESIYSDDVINTLIRGAGNFDRWGFAQNQGALVTAVYEVLPVPKYLHDVITDDYTAAEAVERMQVNVEALYKESMNK